MAKARVRRAAHVCGLLSGAVALLGGPLAHAQTAVDPPDGDVVEAQTADDYTDTDPSALTDFRPTLDPHGTWVDDQTYGTVWTPNPTEVGADFQPYESGGQWDYGSGDYSWQSSYEWGWVCFHYGRWAFSSALGWMWIPGRTYAPAWVTWRVGDDSYPYVGWSPVAPTWVWFSGSATAIGGGILEPWAFTNRSSVMSPPASRPLATGAQAATALQHTKPYVAASPNVAYAPATAQAFASPFALVIPHGPPPSLLGIEGTLPKRALGAGDARARQYAHPSTAMPLGAHGPVRHVVHAIPRAVVAPRGTPTRGRDGRR